MHVCWYRINRVELQYLWQKDPSQDILDLFTLFDNSRLLLPFYICVYIVQWKYVPYIISTFSQNKQNENYT